jgi:hypothetical protein
MEDCCKVLVTDNAGHGVEQGLTYHLCKLVGQMSLLSWPNPGRCIPGLPSIFSRARSQLAPKQVQHIKRHKGRIPIPIGGSIKGTTLAYGAWGIRIKGDGARISAKQLTTAEEAIKRKIKVIKGSKVYMRVFPDIPVCIKVSPYERADRLL